MPFWCYLHMLLFGKKGHLTTSGSPIKYSDQILGLLEAVICPLRFQSPAVKDIKKGAQKWHEGTNQLTRQLREQHYRTMT